VQHPGQDPGSKIWNRYVRDVVTDTGTGTYTAIYIPIGWNIRNLGYPKSGTSSGYSEYPYVIVSVKKCLSIYKRFAHNGIILILMQKEYSVVGTLIFACLTLKRINTGTQLTFLLRLSNNFPFIIVQGCFEYDTPRPYIRPTKNARQELSGNAGQ
jgi:hypothetical protein